MSLRVRIRCIEWFWVAGIDHARWPSEGFFPDDDGLQVLQMKNGIGKTTTLFLLRCLFTGTAPEDELFQRVRYKGTKAKPEDEKSRVELHLSIAGSIWTFALEMDAREGFRTHRFWTVRPRDGRVDGWDPPRDFLGPFEKHDDLARLFLFDTTTVGAAQRSLGKNAVDGAILDLTGLRGVHALVDSSGGDSVLESCYSRRIRTEAVIGAESDPTKKLLRVNRIIADLRHRRTKVATELARFGKEAELFKKTIGGIETDIKRLQDQHNLRSKLAVLDERKGQAEEAIRKSSNALLMSFLDPSNLPDPFWVQVKGFYQKLEELRIPEVIVKEWVQNILDQDVCICGVGHGLSDSQKRNLEEFKSRMVGSTVVHPVFQAKGAVIDSTCGHSGVLELRKQLNMDCDALDEILREIKLLNRRITGDAQRELARLEANLKAANEELGVRVLAIEHLTTPESGSPSWKNQNETFSLNLADYAQMARIPDFDNALDWLRKQQAILANVKRIRATYDLAAATIKAAFEATMDELKVTLLAAANKHLDELQSTGLRIATFRNGMELVDRHGQSQTGANTGGEVSAQYSFLVALQELADIELPIVVDNPTKGLDAQALRSCEEFLPKAFGQCCYLIYPQERLNIPYTCEHATDLATIHTPDAESTTCTHDRKFFAQYDPPGERA